MKKVNSIVRNMPLHELFEGKAVKIVEKYFNKEEMLLFPYKSEAYTNRKLKEFALTLNIKKKVTTHIGRHTFGSLLAEKTNDVVLIKTLMGHKNIETSMIYIKISKSAIENKLKEVNW